MAHKVNVCHISTLTRRGGVETMLVDFLVRSKSERLRHFVICTSSINELTDEIRKLGVLVFQPPRCFHYDPAAIWHMAHWMRVQQIDIVHTYNMVSNCWGGLAAVLAGVPIRIAGEHGTVWTGEPPMAWLETWLYRRADLIVANSKASKTMVIHKRGVSAEKIRVIYNAVAPLPPADSATLRQQLGIMPDDLIVGSIGRLDTPKDYFTFLQAAALVIKARNDVRFVLVGGGPLQDELTSYAQSLGIYDKVIFTGWRRDARALVQMFDVFVSTSLRESLGNVLIEAGLAEKAVIAPAVDGVPEVIVSGKTGILLTPTESVRVPRSPNASPLPREVLINGDFSPPRSLHPEQLAEAILYFLDHPEERQKYGLAAKERMERLFLLDRYVEELEQTYIDLTSDGRL